MSGGRQILLAGAVLATVLSACGGDERQDSDEPRAGQRVEVVAARFPARQQIGATETLAITLRNPGSEPLPGVAVTVRGFGGRVNRPDASDPRRPLWIVGRSPGDESAYDNTWTTGPLGPGARRILRWRVTPVVAGTHKLDYSVAAGLDEAVGGDGSGAGRRPGGTLVARVSDDPARARVDPRTGRVLRQGRSGGSSQRGY